MIRLVVLALTTLLVTVAPSQASLMITSSFGGAPTQTFNADSVTLNANSPAPFLVADGVPFTTNTQTLTFSVSGGNDGEFDFILTQNVTINGVTLPVSQNGHLSITSFADTLTLYTGSPTLFDVGSGIVSFTPLGTSSTATDVGEFPIQLQGVFVYTPAVPEPVTAAVFGALAVGAFGWRRMKAKAAV